MRTAWRAKRPWWVRGKGKGNSEVMLYLRMKIAMMSLLSRLQLPWTALLQFLSVGESVATSKL